MAKIGRDQSILLDSVYSHPKTNLLIFRFESVRFKRKKKIEKIEVEGKDLYLIDHFFTGEEGKELREYTQSATFSNEIYGSLEAKKKGEVPARGMNGRERWDLFSKPPRAIEAISMWLGSLAAQLSAEVTLIPWDLYTAGTSSPALATNFLTEMSEESQRLGIHEDTHPEEGIAFGLPILYKEGYHPPQFVNGEAGRPWLVSLILYTAAENWNPEFGMGTAFYKKDRSVAFIASCIPMRLVLFEGDILHSIEASKPGIKSWRVSYVFKLALNPKRAEQSLKRDFRKSLKSS